MAPAIPRLQSAWSVGSFVGSKTRVSTFGFSKVRVPVAILPSSCIIAAMSGYVGPD